MEGAVSRVDAEFLFDRGFTASRDLGTVGMMHNRVANDEYVVSVVVSNGVLSAHVEYADTEIDGTDLVEVDMYSVEFAKGSISEVYGEMLDFVSAYVRTEELVTV